MIEYIIANSTLASFVGGAFVTWSVSWFYYKRAGDELNTTAKELKKEVQWIQKFIENSKANLKGSAKLSADLTAQPMRT